VRRATGALLGLLACAAAAEPAYANFFADGATILSASRERQEQADDLTLAVTLSGDGRYAVFQTRARNLYADDDPEPPGEYRVGGIFRYEMATGRLRIVANGDRRRESDDELLLRGAQNPSMSRDGRFVAFSTGEQLVPQDTNTNVDVYVRDMELPPRALGAYDLVSARDGSDLPAGYEAAPPDQDFPGRNPGSDLSQEAAISSDGRRVVFKTAARSDLPSRTAPEVDALQVFVRDRLLDRTTLVTRDQQTGEPAGGALGPASISGDGTAVTWTGRNAPAQTRFLNGEGQNPATEYFLWRRIADGPAAPTRRVTAFVDPDDPACPPDAEVQESTTATGPCYGPLAPGAPPGGLLGQVPALSEDGFTASFLHDANPRGGLGGGVGLDLYLTSMANGISRKAGTVELTREGTGTLAVNAGIDGLAMSGDARWAVLATSRTTFVLPALRQLTAPRGEATIRELYLVDLRERTIARILRGLAGEDANGGIGPRVSVDDEGRHIAFVSGASNLFFGDANNQVDAFAVRRLDAPPEVAPEPEPPAPEPEPLPALIGDTQAPRPGRLRVTVRRGRSGEVRLEVVAPAAGILEATVRGRLPNAEGRPQGRPRRLAAVERTVRRRGRLTLRIPLARSLRSRLRRARRLQGQAELLFETRDGRLFERRVTVVFPYRASRRRAARRGDTGRRGGRR